MRNADGAFVDARGTKMPPCIVMLKGMSMQQWLQTPDITADGANKVRPVLRAISQRMESGTDRCMSTES